MRKKKFQFRSETALLQQKPVAWYLAVRMLPSRKHEEPTSLLLLYDKHSGQILNGEFFTEGLSSRKLLRTLEEIMHSSLENIAQSPYRPAMIEFEQQELFSELEPYLAKIEISACFNPQLSLLDDLIQQIMGELSPFKDELDFLNIPGITPELGAEFFKAAADLYRQTPWEYLDDTQPLSISFESGDETYYIFVLGQAETQYGLMIFTAWEDLMAVMAGPGDPTDAVSEHNVLTVNFDTRRNILPGDLRAIQSYGWEIAAENAYPTAMLYTKNDLQRPNLQQINRIIAILKAFSQFIQEDLEPDSDGEYRPVQITYEIKIGQRSTEAEIHYPIKQFHEIKTSHAYGLIKADQPDVQASLKLSDQAWHAEDPQERIRLAKEAISLWSDCVEAYVILGEEAENIDDALEFFWKGVKAGDRALDMPKIDLHIGSVWDIYMVRRYLIAIQGVIECLAEMEEYVSAIPLALRIIRFNPADHQGIRFTFLFILTQLKRDDSIRELLDQYPEETAAAWPYSRALLEFRQRGENRKSRLLLKEAIECNPFVPDYLTGKKAIPEELPEYDSFGDENEAIHYARDYFSAWWQTKGAIEWLKNN